jgi:hypothetical protein
VQAHQLAEAFPTVRLGTLALTAARMLADQHLPGLIVVNEYDHPTAVLPASQLLRLLIPRYIQDDPTLARVLEESQADTFAAGLDGKTVADLLKQEKLKPQIAEPDDNVMEIAAAMAANRSPLVAVVERRHPTAPLIGVITVSRLLGYILPAE